MKKMLVGLSAVLLAIIAAAFITPRLAQPSNFKTDNYYFIYVGLPGYESDITQWQQISQYDYIYNVMCAGEHDGCILITTNTNIISSVLRPAVVNTQINGIHRDPVTGDGVTEVKYRN